MFLGRDDRRHLRRSGTVGVVHRLDDEEALPLEVIHLARGPHLADHAAEREAIRLLAQEVKSAFR